MLGPVGGRLFSAIVMCLNRKYTHVNIATQNSKVLTVVGAGLVDSNPGMSYDRDFTDW
jgi:hypothetical protein